MTNSLSSNTDENLYSDQQDWLGVESATSLVIQTGHENLLQSRVDRVTNVTSGTTGLIVTPGEKKAMLYTLPLSNQENIPLITRVKYNSTLLPASILNVRPDL